MKKLIACLVGMIMLFTGMAAFAVNTVQPGEDFYYLDTANVLSAETEGMIYFSNRMLEEKCGAQIVVAALDSIGNADIYDYAVNMGNSWGIGDSAKNNGFLLLMAIKEENYYAVTGSGLDGIFPASVLKEYFDEYLEADFAAGNYDAGARSFFKAVFEKISDYYNADVTIADGVAAYEAYVASNPGANSYGGAHGGGNANDGPTSVWIADDNQRRGGFFNMLGEFIGSVISLVVLVAVISIVFGGRRRRGGGFFFPLFFMNHHHHHHYHRPMHGPGRPGPRPPRTGFGSGAGRGGFGGGRSGGGGGFRGGAGRGRH